MLFRLNDNVLTGIDFLILAHGASQITRKLDLPAQRFLLNK